MSGGWISLSKVGEDSKEDGETNHPNKVGEIKGQKRMVNSLSLNTMILITSKLKFPQNCRS